MNADQQELAAYQRAVETAKNELARLRQRAEQAEAERERAEADAAALRQAIERLHITRQETWEPHEDPHTDEPSIWYTMPSPNACYALIAALAADRSGADLLAELDTYFLALSVISQATSLDVATRVAANALEAGQRQ